MTEAEHCRDCCCARSWKALGIDHYTCKSIAEHIGELREALVRSVEVIQRWHNMGMTDMTASALWDTYWRRSPEMRPIREALSVNQSSYGKCES